MPRPRKGPRLGGDPHHQRQLMANLAVSLFDHGGITTTVSRAKALRPYAEKLITKGKKGGVHRQRQVVALIHDQLYRSHDFSSVPFSAYARSLAANVFQATGLAPSSIKLQLNVEPVVLPVDKAIPCGLILNELLTNALKHAFPSERRGSVSVALQPLQGGGISLVVADDGVGIGETARRSGTANLAARAERLGGTCTVAPGPVRGTVMTWEVALS